MNTRLPALALGVLVAATTGPWALTAQVAMLPIAETPRLSSRCEGSTDILASPVGVAVLAALADPDDPRRDLPLAAAQDSLEGVLRVQPDRLEDRYLLAMVLGARSEVASGRDRLALAGAMKVEAERVLEADAGHAGAHHLVGRLHAAVQRLGTMKRLLARAVFGGEVLAGASWAEARRHLVLAEEGAPCRPEHHFELARLHVDVDEPQAARREILHVLELTAGRAEFRSLARRAEELAAGLPPVRAAGRMPRHRGEGRRRAAHRREGDL